ncbi:restriction endonuclease subunit S [Rhodobaculum claviforme]|uniref:Type I restriction modification DNA specificity domain-containing protein n=1 Tax=Rhodobaculum claviforme TaxID=1549854 RepID=A0A934TIP1_9RHOB|nr:restriction endonuclease subunit S [Rhodobaculum claviforme]MBK5926870.1 hypothetical protein [Rhodobaculum claviforme]
MRWPTVALAEVASIERDGVAPEAIASGTRYLGLEHIESGGQIIGGEPVEAGDLASTKFAFSPRHVLFGKLRPYLAKIALPDFGGVCSTDILPVLPGCKLHRNYLAHFLRQPEVVALASQRATGANLPRLSPKALASFDIPLPPLEEQRRIAAILDQADALRRLRARALTRLDALGQAIFQEMFGDPFLNTRQWPRQAIGELCSRVSVGVVVKPASHYQDNGVPAIRGTNIKSDGIDLSDLVHFSEAANAGPLKKSRVWEGDVIAVRSGRPGLSAVVPPELDGANCIDILIASPKRDQLLPEFLRDFMNSSGGRGIVLSESRGQVQQHLNVKSLSEAMIIVPPLQMQQKYLERCRTLRERRTIAVRAAATLDSLFASLQHRAFRGEL